MIFFKHFHFALYTLLVFQPLFLFSESTEKQQSLEQCIEYGLKNSPVLKQAMISHEDRMLQTAIAKARYIFDINYSTDYQVEEEQHNNSLSLSQDIIGGINVSAAGAANYDNESDSDNASLSITLSKKLLGSGSSFLESSEAIIEGLVGETIALNNIRKAKRKLRQEISQSYYRVIRDVQSLGIRERRLEMSKQTLEHAKVREQPLDIITAEIEIPQNELALLQAEEQIKNGLDNLKEIIGMPILQTLEIDPVFNFQSVELNTASDIEFSLNNHEDTLNNRLELKRLQDDYKISRKNILPDVSTSASHRELSKGDEINLQGDAEHTIGLNFSWKFGGARKRANYKIARNAIRRNELSYYSLTQSKTKSIIRLSRQLNELKRSIILQEERLSLNERQIELYKDRWENGEIGILELVRSQSSLEDGKVSLINQKINYLEQLTEYQFEIGK